MDNPAKKTPSPISRQPAEYFITHPEVDTAGMYSVASSAEKIAEILQTEYLHLDHWIDLTGIGKGRHGSYVITREGVFFRRWSDHDIAIAPTNWQGEGGSSWECELERDNRIAKDLLFPFTLSQLIEFVGTAIGLHCFSVPDVLRQAAESFPGNALRQKRREPEALSPNDEITLGQAEESQPGTTAQYYREQKALPSDDGATKPPENKISPIASMMDMTNWRKRNALIKELQREWPMIERNLRDASRHPELQAAKRKPGYWDIEHVRVWGRANGKIAQEGDARFKVLENAVRVHRIGK